MDGRRGRPWQPRGRGRWSPRPNAPFNHPQTPPPPPVVGDEQLSGCGSNSSWGRPTKDGRKSSHYMDKREDALALATATATATCSVQNQNQNDPLETPSPSSDCGTGMLLPSLVHVTNKLNISDTQHKIPLTLTPAHSDDNNSEIKNPDPKSTTSPTHQTELHDPFDICLPNKQGTVVLKPSLLVKNRERRNEIKRSNMDTTSKGLVLRPGMVLLKAYLSLTDQINIVKRCRDLGLGCGGFYQPGYREGTKLHLKMMCLGKNWDPQTSQYGDHRPSDGAKPPSIPVEFHQFIDKAIRDSHALIQQHSKTTNPENILPWMSSDICIVNFYSQNGRLGLHQDKDESEESLRQGLPVVSFSLGDSADFLYSDERDVDAAQKVVLESGDVLIFGGRSRNVFHGVTAIHSMTTPKLLLEETNLRPGRLNLTFRQY